MVRGRVEDGGRMLGIGNAYDDYCMSKLFQERIYCGDSKDFVKKVMDVRRMSLVGEHTM